jgi:pimeloyl-ACP methyl ester carboxylesterase
MAHIEVDGIKVAYELVGKGTPVVWTPGGFAPRNIFAYTFAGRCSASYKVCLWDRPSSGASGFLMKDTPSEWHLWAEVLHEMCKKLDILPAFIGGGSAGSEIALLFGYLYPEDVKGLILANASEANSRHGQELSKYHYLMLAEAAEKGGMERVFETLTDPAILQIRKNMLAGWDSWFISSDPDTRERILSTDSKFFARTLRRWNEWMMSPRLYCSNLSEEEMSHIAMPAIVGPGDDPAHPKEVAQRLFDLLPNAEWVDFPKKWSSQEVEWHMRQNGSVGSQLILHLPFYEDFIRRVESGEFVAG